ncbi:hypothetical protein O0I10_008241 [Lichtheimia ornata]|uniref:FUN14 family-domain-containing protein n=1 Tax=Lichtheimia ornata TaxID=688661 RepID=A0AAD7UYN0_9FUNG|nr:uncharacterized protein O0I10_008241 [Lichtheimia ornata]KAJ8656019.1 hypothetical protein O0I10_008241 [Lichtheimia ornata]
MQQYGPRRSFVDASPSSTMTAMRGFQASLKPLAIATATIGSSAFLKKPVLCQQAYANIPPAAPPATGIFDDNPGSARKPTDAEVSKSLFHTGELSFGAVLGVCTGYLIKKVGKLFALAIGAGFIFLQYMSFKGYITVHWDRLEGGYQRRLDVDKDGRVTHRDIRSHWDRFVGFLTHNIQFKSTFLVGLYTGIRYG